MNKLLTPYEVADILSVSYETALGFIKYSGIAYKQIGKKYRVDEKALETFLSRKDSCRIRVSEE